MSNEDNLKTEKEYSDLCDKLDMAESQLSSALRLLATERDAFGKRESEMKAEISTLNMACRCNQDYWEELVDHINAKLEKLERVRVAAEEHCDSHHDDEAMTLKNALAAAKEA